MHIQRIPARSFFSEFLRIALHVECENVDIGKTHRSFEVIREMCGLWHSPKTKQLEPSVLHNKKTIDTQGKETLIT